MTTPATIVHDPSEATPLCPALGLFLQPIARVSITVALPGPRPGAAPAPPVSTWEVMERLRALAAAPGGAVVPGGGAVPGATAPPPAPRPQLSALRIARCTPDLVRFEAELETRGLARACLARLDGRTLRLGGGNKDALLRVHAHELPLPGGSNGDPTAPGGADSAAAPDTLHLQGLPCRWFADAPAAGGAVGAGTAPPGGNPAPERPSEAALRRALGVFGPVRHVDIPMLDPYREETPGGGVGGGGVGGVGVGGAGLGGRRGGGAAAPQTLPQFEAFVRFRDPAGAARALAALRGNRLMLRGGDGKAVACGVKVTYDATQHLSEAAIRRRQREGQKLRELERRREAQKRREREAEARRRAEERRQQEAEAQARARRREEKQARREARASRRHRRRAEREAQRRLRGRVRREERRLLLAQRALQAVRLVAELLGRAKAARLRRLQEAELRRVEQEKERALGLQRRERELRRRLVALLLGRGDPADAGHAPPDGPARPDPAPGGPASALLDILHRVSRQRRAGATPAGPDDPAGDPGAEAPSTAPVTSSSAPVTSSSAPVTSSSAPVTSPAAPATSSADPGDPGDPGDRRRRSEKDRERERKRGRRHHPPHPPHRGDRDPSTRSRSRSPPASASASSSRPRR